MKKEYIKGYLIDEEDVGCEKWKVCFTCPYTCKEEKTDKRKQQVKDAGKRYRDKNKEKIKEKNRLWREKQRLAKLLDQKRQDAEEKAITPLIP